MGITNRVEVKKAMKKLFATVGKVYGISFGWTGEGDEYIFTLTAHVKRNPINVEFGQYRKNVI